MFQTETKDKSLLDVVFYTNEEKYIYIPNEIFDDLKSLSSSQAAFAYCYYYLISYLYRYTKYSLHKFTQPELKSILGYAPTNAKIDRIVKKNGVLDQLGYTQTTTDYPISWSLDENNLPEFELLSDLKKDSVYVINEKNYKVKIPVKAFWRTINAREDGYYNGTFYEADNTHRTSIATFFNAIEDEQIGAVGFYIYAFLKKQNDKFKTGVFMNYNKLSENLNLTNATLYKYIPILEQRGYIKIKRPHPYSGIPNKYIAKEVIKT